MLMPWRAAVRVAVLACVIAAAGCGADEAPDVTDTTMRGALLEPAEIGPTWTESKRTPPPNPLVRLCAGEAPAPAVPGTPSVVSRSLVDEGRKGAQTLDQIALVYPDAEAADAGVEALRAAAAACPPTVSQPAQVNEERSEPAYTETVATAPLTFGEWSGFVVERHKLYDPKRPAAADTAVVVLALRNVVMVGAYAIYRLEATAAAPQFTTDWRRLVGTIVGRVEG